MHLLIILIRNGKNYTLTGKYPIRSNAVILKDRIIKIREKDSLADASNDNILNQ